MVGPMRDYDRQVTGYEDTMDFYLSAVDSEAKKLLEEKNK